MLNERVNATIVGAGLVGSLLACYLAKRGLKINVFERRSDMRKKNISAGRSINLALSTRGWTALEKLGLKDQVKNIAIPMKGRMIHQSDGSTDFQPYGIGDQSIYSISRKELNKLLLDTAVQYDDVSVHFNEKCIDIDFDKMKLTFENQKGKNMSYFSSDLIFGADGAFSAVRHQFQHKPLFNFSQSYLEYGYKELTIPAADAGTHRIEPNALHIWPRNNFMLIALPNMDGTFTCTFFAPFHGENSFDQLQTVSDILSFFTTHFPSAIQHLPDIAADFFENPTSALVTVRCSPWNYNKAVLIGDAAHAVVPFYGQGMNAGFEDCRLLDELIDQHQFHTWEDIFQAFSATRIHNANAIADLALRNFVEMRDAVTDENFLKRKKLERVLTEKLPDHFESQYSMVTFSNKPYKQALEKGDEQLSLLNMILNNYDEAEWGESQVLNVTKEWLKEHP